MSLAQSSMSYIDQHRLCLKLRPILVGELYLAKKLRNPVYIYKSGAFSPVINEGSVPTKDQISILIKNNYREVYAYSEDVGEIKNNLQTALIKITRSLSVGDPIQNGVKDLKLISLNMGGLYQNPYDDELLMVQFQSTQNLGKFLLENKRHQPQFYQTLMRENFHFTLSQPMLSSMILLAFMQSIHLFHEKEMENLFLTSYFKDIGMSMIPDEKYDLKTMTTRDQQLFGSHADFSFDLLEGRIPLSKNYLTIIRHHHFMNDKLKDLVAKSKRRRDQEIVFGVESTLVSVFDILVAMTSERPYRPGVSLFQSLDLVKKLMADDYPQEFRALVVFLKQFYKN